MGRERATGPTPIPSPPRWAPRDSKKYGWARPSRKLVPADAPAEPDPVPEPRARRTIPEVARAGTLRAELLDSIDAQAVHGDRIQPEHAFTLLSQMYEKHRISNTGNVYTRVFYQDRDQHWYPDR